jgi:hypothetical protein
MAHETVPKKLYGWYSEGAHSISAVEITYNTPDNIPVVVTSVTDSPNDSKTSWEDSICKGEVTNFIKSTRDFTTKFKKY